MRKLTLPEVLEVLNTISIADYGVESLQENTALLSNEEALLILKQAISSFYVSTAFQKLTDTAMLSTNIFFISFLALREKLVGTCPQEFDCSRIDSTLASWNRRWQLPIHL